MSARPLSRPMPAPRAKTLPLRTFLVFMRDDIAGDETLALGQIDATDATSAEHGYAKREGMTYLERRELRARAKESA